MSFIITSKTRAVGNRAPTGRVHLNRDSPQAQGVQYVAPNWDGQPLGYDITGRWGTPSSSGTGNEPTRDVIPGLGTRGIRHDGSAWGLYMPVAMTDSWPTSEGTVSAWVQADSADNGLWNTGSAGQNSHYEFSNLWYDNSFCTTRSTLGSVTEATTKELHLLTVTMDAAGTRRGYIDGAENGNVTGKGFGLAAQQTMIRDQGGYTFDGLMGAFNLWTRALSAAEVWALYDPQTRWDLYWQPRRTYFLPPAATTDSVFIVTSKTRAAPQRVLGIDHSSPVSRGLIDAVDFLHGVGVSHAAGQEILTSVGGAHASAAKWGRGVEVEDTEGVTFTPNQTNFDDGISVTILCQYTGTGYWQTGYLYDEDSGGAFRISQRGDTDGITISLDARTLVLTSPPDMRDGAPHTITFRCEGKGATAWYEGLIDGISYGRTQPGSQGSIDIGSSLVIGNIGGGAYNRASGQSFGFFLIHDRYISDAEVALLHHSPTQWSWAQQAPRRTYFMPSAAGATTTTSDVPASDITLTAQPPTSLRSLITNIPAV